MRISYLNFLIFALLTLAAHAQDERFFRTLFTGEATRDARLEDSEKKYSYVLQTPMYAIDINDDGKNEYVVFSKKDSEDWLIVLDQYREKLFSYKFETKGFDSGLYRIEKKTLNDQSNVLVLHYYEGKTQYIHYQSTARIYALAVDKLKENKMSFAVMAGPSFFEEYKSRLGHFHIRNYSVNVLDLNNDKTNELIIKYRNQSTVFTYNGNGKWLTFRQEF